MLIRWIICVTNIKFCWYLSFFYWFWVIKRKVFNSFFLFHIPIHKHKKRINEFYELLQPRNKTRFEESQIQNQFFSGLIEGYRFLTQHIIEMGQIWEDTNFPTFSIVTNCNSWILNLLLIDCIRKYNREPQTRYKQTAHQLSRLD